ncbi:MAG: flagellar basal body-associated protein FliL [Beijerinckiaceae bacterium]
MAKKKQAADDGAEGANHSKGSKKKLIMIAAAVLLAGAGAGGWFMFARKPAETLTDAANKAQPQKKVAFVELKEMTINLAASQGQEQRTNFLKLKIALEVSDPKLTTEIQPLVPRIEDAFQTYMRELRANEIDGSSAMYRLREELLKRVNIAVYPAKVDAVLFKEVLLQ